MSELLDLPPSVGVVSSTWRWDLCTAAGEYIGALYPERDGITIANAPTQSEIKRTCRGFVLDERQWRAVNPLTDTVRAVQVMSDGTELRCGLFLFPDDERDLVVGGGTVTPTLFDRGLILKQPTDRAWSLGDGQAVAPFCRDFLEARGITRHAIADSPTATTGPIAWPIGTNGTQVLAKAFELLGYWAPYFDRNGVLIGRLVDDLSWRAPLEYPLSGDRSRIYRGSAKVTRPLASAPNLWVVVNGALNGGEVVGRFRATDDPRPYDVPELVRLQGTEDTEGAVRAARAKAAHGPGPEGTLTFASPPDARHDTFDVLAVGEVLYYEHGWDLQCAAGGMMRHTARQVLPS
jgi:hypothetical protein